MKHNLKTLIALAFIASTIGISGCGCSNPDKPDNSNKVSDTSKPSEDKPSSISPSSISSEPGEESSVAPSVHEHTFSEEWSHDETYHWHAATCEHTDEVKDKAVHEYGEWTVVTPASYTADGLEKRVCTVCGYEETRTIPKLEQQEATITITKTSKVYDGLDITFTAEDYTLTEGYDGTPVFKFYSDEALANEVTDTKKYGDYYVVASLPETDAFKAYTAEAIKFTVEKATIVYTAPTAKENLVYDGTEQPLFNLGSITTENCSVGFRKKGTSGSYLTTSTGPTAKDAGTYDYEWIIMKLNYVTVKGEVSATISRKSLTVASITGFTKPYDGNNHFTYRMTVEDGVVEEDEIDLAFDAYQLGSVPIDDVEDSISGDFRIKNMTLTGDNYSINPNLLQQLPITITPIAYEDFEAPTANNLAYTKAAQKLLTAGTTTSGTFKYRVGGGEWSSVIPSATTAGDYEVQWKIEGLSTNYAVPSGTIACRINKKALTNPSFTTLTKTYDGNNIFTYDLGASEGVIAGDTVTATVEVVNSGTSNPIINVADSTSAVSFSSATLDNQNYYGGLFEKSRPTELVKKPSVSITKNNAPISFSSDTASTSVSLATAKQMSVSATKANSYFNKTFGFQYTIPKEEIKYSIRKADGSLLGASYPLDGKFFPDEVGDYSVTVTTIGGGDATTDNYPYTSIPLSFTIA